MGYTVTNDKDLLIDVILSIAVQRRQMMLTLSLIAPEGVTTADLERSLPRSRDCHFQGSKLYACSGSRQVNILSANDQLSLFEEGERRIFAELGLRPSVFAIFYWSGEDAREILGALANRLSFFVANDDGLVSRGPDFVRRWATNPDWDGSGCDE